MPGHGAAHLLAPHQVLRIQPHAHGQLLPGGLEVHPQKQVLRCAFALGNRVHPVKLRGCKLRKPRGKRRTLTEQKL